MLGWLAAKVAESALMTSPIGAFLKRIPTPVWKGLAIVLALVAAYLVHQHYAHKAIRAAHDAGYAEAKAEDQAAAKKIEARARATEAKGREITQKSEVQNVEAIGAIHSAYELERMRKAPVIGIRVTGGALPGFSDSSRLGDGAAAKADVSGLDSLAALGLAVVPWAPLLDHGERCDVTAQKLTTLQNWIRLEQNAFSIKESSAVGGSNGGR